MPSTNFLSKPGMFAMIPLIRGTVVILARVSMALIAAKTTSSMLTVLNGNFWWPPHSAFPAALPEYCEARAF